MNIAVPTKVSQLSNDSGYQTGTQVSDAVTKAVAAADHLKRKVVASAAAISTSAADAAKALDEGKADSVPLHEITIPSEGREKDSSGNYRLNMDISGLTDEDTVNVLIDPHELGTKEEDLVETQSSTDTLTLIARAVPTAELKAYYYNVKGDILVAVGSVVLPGMKYSLPPATADTLGGVMIGDGLSVDENGKAAFAPDNMSVPLQKALGTQLAGEGLRVDENGKAAFAPDNMSVPMQKALGTQLAGEGMRVDETGKINVDQTGALACFPVGIVISMVGDTSPAALFGGTWEQVAPDRVLMGASRSHAAGTTVKAGLPNITGSFVADVKKGEHEVSGAFTAGNAIASTGEYNNFSDVYKFSLDASKSNAIYGRSATVQPAAYYVHIWRRVA